MKAMPIGALFAIVAAISLGAKMATPAMALDVDVGLAIMIDVSGSIDQIELATQSQGWADALTELANEGLFTTSGPHGAAFIHVGFWSNGVVGSLPSYPVIVDSPDDITPIADYIRSWDTTYSLTSPYIAILDAAHDLIDAEQGPWLVHSSRKMILLSGDGVENVEDLEGATAGARDAAIRSGIDQINGLYILGDPSEPPDELRRFYVNEVAGGLGGFATSVQSGHTDLHKFKEVIKGYVGFSLAPATYPPPVDIIYPTEGDFDGDGDVDGDDLTQWRGDFGENRRSDADGDTDSDGDDFLVWQRQLAVGNLASSREDHEALLPATNVAVPEPATLVMFMLLTSVGGCVSGCVRSAACISEASLTP